MNKELQLKLDRKQSRIAARCLQELFAKRALETLTINKMREEGFLETLGRTVRIAADGREAFMSSTANAAYRRLGDVIAEAGSAVDVCTQSDLRSALREVYAKCWQTLQRPEDVDEFLNLICEHVNLAVKRYTIVAALRGVELEGVPEMPLGEIRLFASAEGLIGESGVGKRSDLDKPSLKRLMNSPCLVGSKIGTHAAVERWYREQAYLAAGMLAVEAGASYDRAATSFFIEPEFGHPTGSGGSVHLFWCDDERHLGHNITFERGQQLKLSADRVAELTEPGAFDHAFYIFQRQDRSELEEAISRAVFWYGDAHRDSVQVMQFIKYWSCLECLLGGPGEDLTETLAIGVVTVLSFGHYRLLDLKEWRANVRTVKRLYGIRSRAVHRASHSHVAYQDLVLLGTWTAWVIYNAISFSNAGMQDIRTLWQRVLLAADEQALRLSNGLSD